MEIKSLQEVMETSSPSEAFREAYYKWAKENPDSFNQLVDATEKWMSYINDSRIRVADRDILHIAYDRMWISFYGYYQEVHEQSPKVADELMRNPYIDLDMYRFCMYCIHAYIEGEEKHAMNMARCAYLRVRKQFGELDTTYTPILMEWVLDLDSD